jgi:hypothetical protein
MLPHVLGATSHLDTLTLGLAIEQIASWLRTEPNPLRVHARAYTTG